MSDTPRSHTEKIELTFWWDENGKCTIENEGIESLEADELYTLAEFLDRLRGLPVQRRTEEDCQDISPGNQEN